MKNLNIEVFGIIGYGDMGDSNPNYGNDLIIVSSSMGEVLGQIYFSQSEYNNPIYFNSSVNKEELSEEEIEKTQKFCIIGEYKYKKIFFNKKEVEVAFVIGNNNKILFIAYAYNDIYANVIFPNTEKEAITSEEIELIAYIEHLYS